MDKHGLASIAFSSVTEEQINIPARVTCHPGRDVFIGDGSRNTYKSTAFCDPVSWIAKSDGQHCAE